MKIHIVNTQKRRLNEKKYTLILLKGFNSNDLGFFLVVNDYILSDTVQLDPKYLKHF